MPASDRAKATAATTRLFRRRLWLPVIIGLLIVPIGLPVFAQRPQLRRPEEPTEEKPPEPKKPKKVKGPRAVALLQTGSNGKTALIPVAILVDGKFYDASLYKADPVPMALYSGTVYEVEQTGSSQGLFTVSRALHSKSAANPHPWLGTGSYLANGSQAATNFRKAEDKPVGIESVGSTVSSDEPPRLTRGNESSPATAPPPSQNKSSPSDSSSGKNPPSASPASSEKPATTPAPSGSSPDKSTTTGSSAKPADASSSAPAQETNPSSSPAPSSTGKTGASQSPQAQPSASSPPASSPPASSQPPSSQKDQSQESGNYYRPALRRGKPTEQLPPGEQEDEEGLTPAKPASNAAASGAKPTTYQYVPAISDDGGPNPRSYKFFWKTGEEDERRAQMLALAATELNAYLAAEAKNSIAANPAPSKTAAPTARSRKPAAKPQPVFENVKFQGFDVWGNNQPVMVLTTEAHLPQPSATQTAPPQLTYSITLVARTDIYGELRKLYVGVTDKFHLDVTPQLQLIDVVDADGDGRGELLFSETTDAGSGYILYRATPDKLWKLFDSQGES